MDPAWLQAATAVWLAVRIERILRHHEARIENLEAYTGIDAPDENSPRVAGFTASAVDNAESDDDTETEETRRVQ